MSFTGVDRKKGTQNSKINSALAFMKTSHQILYIHVNLGESLQLKAHACENKSIIEQLIKLSIQ